MSHPLNLSVVPSISTLSYCAPRPDFNGICWNSSRFSTLELCRVNVLIPIEVQGMFHLCCFSSFFQQITSTYPTIYCPPACCRKRILAAVGLLFSKSVSIPYIKQATRLLSTRLRESEKSSSVVSHREEKKNRSWVSSSSVSLITASYVV